MIYFIIVWCTFDDVLLFYDFKMVGCCRMQEHQTIHQANHRKPPRRPQSKAVGHPPNACLLLRLFATLTRG